MVPSDHFAQRTGVAESLEELSGGRGRGDEASRRKFLHALVGAAATMGAPALAIGAASEEPKLALTEFVLQDVEFRLSTWIPPGDDGDAIDDWVASTEANVERLVLICDGCALDPQVKEAVRKVTRIADIYRQLLHDLELVQYINDVTAAGRGATVSGAIDNVKHGYKVGYDFGQCARRFITNFSVQAAGAVATSGASLVFFVGESVESAERSARIKSLQQRQHARTIQVAKERIALELRYLSDMSSALQTRFPSLRAPRFEAMSVKQGFVLDPARTPYAYVAEAYRALGTDGVTAGRKFAQAAERLPDSVRSEPLAASYVANFPLLAGHLLEFESRARGERRLAEEALVYFARADALLALQGTSAFKVAYPYQIATARALVTSGQPDKALQLVKRIQAGADNDSEVAVASRSYDLAAVLARTGRNREALEMLRSSYRLFPRRDPQALRDPALRELVAREPDAVREIADSPLIGHWKGESGEYIFYADGTVWQSRRILTYTGRWQSEDGKYLRLFDRQGVADARPAFVVSGDTLTLLTDNRFTFMRTGDAGLLNGIGSGPSRSKRSLLPDGRWTWADGRKVLDARFTTSSSASNPKRLFWYSHEDPLVGRVNQLLSME